MAVINPPQILTNGLGGQVLWDGSGNLIVQPQSGLALQAQATTSSATGGNARGANAVDWQTSRTNAANVASGSYSTLGGGANNTVSGTYASILAGQLNTSAGYYNVIGGGYTNSGTLGSAVTTQSATMNGTTAVTLSGSNASIKVGQYITGTSIANDTYVAAISGTSLTLSKNASGSSTNTLSFYTPHGVVVGGGNNQATGAYSFIGGGGDAGTAANRNVASGDWSIITGGYKNTASGFASCVLGGSGNTASGSYAVVAGGGIYAANTASGSGSFVAGGWANQATSQGAVTICGSNAISNAVSSACLGGGYGSTRSITGATVFAANGQTLTSGGFQSVLYVPSGITTDATPKILTTDQNAAGSTNQVILPNNSAYSFRATIIGGVTGAGNTASWILQGAIKRGSGVGTTAIVGTVNSILLAQDSGASTWAVSATADTTNGGLAITVTGQASTTIRWVCKVETTEMTY